MDPVKLGGSHSRFPFRALTELLPSLISEQRAVTYTHATNRTLASNQNVHAPDCATRICWLTQWIC